MYTDTCKTSHRGLNYLRVIGVGGLLTAYHMSNAKPVGYPYYRTEVARVLNKIESNDQLLQGGDSCYTVFFRHLEHRPHLLRMHEEANTP